MYYRTSIFVPYDATYSIRSNRSSETVTMCWAGIQRSGIRGIGASHWFERAMQLFCNIADTDIILDKSAIHRMPRDFERCLHTKTKSKS